MHLIIGNQIHLRVIGVFVYQDVFKSVFQPFTIVLWAGIPWAQEITEGHLYLFLNWTGLLYSN